MSSRCKRPANNHAAAWRTARIRQARLELVELEQRLTPASLLVTDGGDNEFLNTDSNTVRLRSLAVDGDLLNLIMRLINADGFVYITNVPDEFDAWVRAFVAHVEAKGPLPDIKAAELSAATTTNQAPRKAG